MNAPSPLKHWSADELRVFVYPDRAAMGVAAAADAAAALNAALARGGSARVILASAPSQREMIAALVEAPVDWARVTIFHMDEYVGLGPEHPASFRRWQRDHTLAHIRPAAFHGVRGEAPDPAAECERYAALLAEAPIDLVCLGIGENGHLAFNDPPVADFDDPALVKVVELDEACRRQQVADGCFASVEEMPRLAITLSIPALVNARDIVCVVPGPRKALAIRDTLSGPISTACPASVLRRSPVARLYVDTAATGLVE